MSSKVNCLIHKNYKGLSLPEFDCETCCEIYTLNRFPKTQSVDVNEWLVNKIANVQNVAKTKEKAKLLRLVKRHKI